MTDQEKDKAMPEDRRWDELKFLQDSLYKVWSAFLLYFIFVHTAVYGIVALLLRTDVKPPSRNLVLMAVGVGLSAEVLSIAVTIALGKYSSNVTRRAKSIVDEGHFHPRVDARILLPAGVVDVAAPACVASFIVGALCLMYLALRGS